MKGPVTEDLVEIATQAALWGADQELQACINFVYDNELCDPNFYKDLRTARRPEPPSEKEQALEALEALERIDRNAVSQMRTYTIHDDLIEDVAIIRRALEVTSVALQ